MLKVLDLPQRGQPLMLRALILALPVWTPMLKDMRLQHMISIKLALLYMMAELRMRKVEALRPMVPLTLKVYLQ